ncbi:MAG: S9 family peptidase [bacterium]|nr:S9 family peptidase [bacterium]
MRTVRRGMLVLVALLLGTTGPSFGGPEDHERFFERLRAMCGARFEGRAIFPEDPGEAFRGKTLVAIVESCKKRELRIPFRVGEDASRTWILRRTAEGLELKHDHRHLDGTPDEITDYGGTTAGPGTALTQSFPADEHTAELIPDAATNEWRLSFSEDGSELTYYLERHGKPRFEAVLQRVAPSGTEPLTFGELMKFRQIENASISKDGGWIAYTLRPDRGEGEAVARAVDGGAEHRIERGSAPELSSDSRWMAATILPTQKERDEVAAKNGEGEDDDGPRNGLSYVSLADGVETRVEEIESFELSEDGRWIVWKHHEPRAEEEEEGDAAPDAAEEQAVEEKEAEPEDDEERPLGTRLVLRDLRSGKDVEIQHVAEYTIDEPSRFLVYAAAGPFGTDNGIYARDLGGDPSRGIELHRAETGRYTQLTWADESSRLGFVAAVDDDLHDPGPADVWFWDGSKGGKPKRLATSAKAPDGWRIPSTNDLTWSRDGERLFFGYAWIDPVREERRLESKQEQREERERKEQEEARKEAGEPEPEDDEAYDPYDVETLLDERGLDVWHGDDPLIVPNQKVMWDEVEKDRVYLAVAHVDSGKVVRLADRELPDVWPHDNARAALAASSQPYLKLRTWDGWYSDAYHVDLRTGERTLVATKLRGSTAELSPDGRYVAYWRDPHWYLWDADDGSTRNLTEGLDVPFADEDDDYPQSDPGYGIADWVEGDRGLLIYDKFDVWRFSTGDDPPRNLTGGEGRRERRVYRVVDLDDEADWVEEGSRVLLHGYHDRNKNDGFWETNASKAKLKRLVEQERRFRFLAKAEEADRVLYTRQSYREFPDLWVAGPRLAGGTRLTNANPQLARFAWGAAELVEWTSADGVELQGVLIKPGNYEEGKRYPVLVYFYRFFSQRLHEFNEPVINHRPSFPFYASNDYAVFLPDVRFEIGRPGISAVKALVPGVQKLVDMGLADPDAIGLHGHSWSGYQAAYAVTQTNIFAAAVAGAPVSNMTSAYSAIRLGSGLARQFQYEQSQSRIGASMDADLPKYIENSPVFHARHVETPLLIQFGDVDEAVPWQQGIELYLALRRLDKGVVFLQYRGEPHHLKQYPNKLDYSIKMKQFFDHHLLGEPAPPWMTEGVPYRGE